MATPTRSRARPVPHFAIVGSPRSGTTLVQRLCSEIDGVVVPYETHFFSAYLPLCRPRFPLFGDRLLASLRDYLALPTSAGLGISAEEVAARAGGGCEDAAVLFAAILEALAAPRQSVVIGEKTPLHLRHWQSLVAANPEIRLIAVVRDPRAVVASRMRVPWGEVDIRALALTWGSDQATLRRAGAALGERQFLWLRFEDVVAGGYEAARSRVAAFLGFEVSRVRVPPPEALFHDWEVWKSRAVLAPDPARAAAWRTELDPRDAAVVASIAGGEMARFGYDRGPRPTLADRLSLAAWHGRRRASVHARRASRLLRRVFGMGGGRTCHPVIPRSEP